jgi:hypothetical protein
VSLGSRWAATRYHKQRSRGWSRYGLTDSGIGRIPRLLAAPVARDATMATDLLIVLGLILLNGAFALSEIAIVSSRRARLVQLADGGSAGAQVALRLAEEPTRFLSSVQVGITSIGILSGAIGEAAVAGRLRQVFERVPVLAPHADPLALGTMVIGLTYVSLILGELVPKRLAMTAPERIAALIARPMQILAVADRTFHPEQPRHSAVPFHGGRPHRVATTVER